MPISFSPGVRPDARMRGAGVTAVLGPTNTGKTHLAIERMLAHSSGLIGLPLRLLAREVYNKVADRVGADSVALITGEEKIKPANPRFWVSTVEAMPRDLDPAFVAIDEIQLAADFERGHVFTDRILNRRGREETLILGAATMKPMVERLLPGANIVSRPRLSQLTFAGDRKLTRLPSRSAVVAFSADEVYAIAELIRRQRGGAAVVLGALSPRTRNAQVALYQSGDVDHLVATDAIGMGLNLDVDHVAFASDRKFDGYQFRNLAPAELAQIAGRAGRATRDGTFGTTGRCAPFDDELVQRLESHSFEPLKLLQWRNSDLDFASIGALQASLSEIPTEPGLTRAPLAEDILVLEHAARDEAIRALATSRSAVERLWEACQVPDYRKIAPANHAELVTTLYGFLMREGKIPDEWFARQVAQADHPEGDIDSLSTRIAHVRTWTFVANRLDWLADPDHWQGVTRAVEDKLSDALHERLTARFVDRRTSVLMRRLRENTTLESEISKTGEVTVEGHLVGRLEGFRFAADPSAGGSEAKALNAAAQKALAGEIEARATKLSQAPDELEICKEFGWRRCRRSRRKPSRSRLRSTAPGPGPRGRPWSPSWATSTTARPRCSTRSATTNVAAREAGGITQHIGAYSVDRRTTGRSSSSTPPATRPSPRMRARGRQGHRHRRPGGRRRRRRHAADPRSHRPRQGRRRARSSSPSTRSTSRTPSPSASSSSSPTAACCPRTGAATPSWCRLRQEEAEPRPAARDDPAGRRTCRTCKANPDKPAQGTVLEAQLDKGRGPVATILVQNGTLHVGDFFICGAVFGKCAPLFDDGPSACTKPARRPPSRSSVSTTCPSRAIRSWWSTDAVKAKRSSPSGS